MAVFTFRYIFACPHPTPFSFNARMFFRLWDINILLISIVAISFFIYFYFFSKPTRFALIKFYLLFGITIITSVFLSIFLIYPRTNSLVTEGAKINYSNFEVIFISAIANIITVFEIYLIFFIIFQLLGLLNFPWRLKAMRRYPFKYKYN